jgi:hypothetical protein
VRIGTWKAPEKSRGSVFALWVSGRIKFKGVHSRMSEHHRHCKCGAVYSRTQSMAPGREVNSFECAVCGETLESWNTAWVPTYRMIIGPVQQPTSRTRA